VTNTVAARSAPRPQKTLALLTALTLGCLAPAAFAQPEGAAPADEPQGQQTVAVAALGSYDSLLSDADYLGGLVGRPGVSQMVEQTLNFFTQVKGLVGVDKSRPMGVVLQTDGVQFIPIGCLPINDLESVLGIAQGFGFEPLDAGDGVTELEMPDRTIYLKAVGEWTYVAQTIEALSSVPSDPLPMLNELVSKYDLGVRVMAQQVPPMYRQVALQQLRMGVEQGLEQQPEETDEQFELRREMSMKQLEQLALLINDLDEMTVGWSVDPEGKRTFLEGAYTLSPESELLKQLEGYKDPRTDYVGFKRPDAGFSMAVAVDTPPEVVEEQRGQIEASIEMLRKQFSAAMEEQSDEIPDENVRNVLKQVGADLFDVLEDVALSGEMDLAGSLKLGGNTFSLIAGGKVPDPAKVEAAVKKLVDVAKEQPDSENITVEWDADEHEGVAFHTMKIEITDDAEDAAKARAVFGEELPIAFGVGEESLYLAVGAESLEACKQAIDASRADADASVLPLEMTIALGQVIAFAEQVADEQNRPAVAMMSQVLATAEGADHIRITQSAIERGVTQRMVAEEGVIKAIGVAAAQAAAQAQQQQQQGGDQEW